MVPVHAIEHRFAAGPLAEGDPPVAVAIRAREPGEALLAPGAVLRLRFLPPRGPPHLVAGQHTVAVRIVPPERLVVAAPFRAGDHAVVVGVHSAEPLLLILSAVLVLILPLRVPAASLIGGSRRRGKRRREREHGEQFIDFHVDSPLPSHPSHARTLCTVRHPLHPYAPLAPLCTPIEMSGTPADRRCRSRAAATSRAARTSRA